MLAKESREEYLGIIKLVYDTCRSRLNIDRLCILDNGDIELNLLIENEMYRSYLENDILAHIMYFWLYNLW